ncbi:hypothetical protein NIIDNTM18_42390 [Mycolicibacterium litorale]|uniref:Uncharacterized protein n=1 Tax=Mycolicibacterium litorale TaxID=758802 RepID=A0A6S6PB57_9MYCO|nr:hypothetical protein [Mycolicibacterium litorale]BCI54961.1 hypothetical protein NIIDNTM18_42390 [Mycolicibacterium litorale]
MKISVTFNSRYCETDCTFCNRRIHTASLWAPSWISELVGKARFGLHRRTPTHKRNRPTNELAPALQIDPVAFAKRQAQTRTVIDADET